MNRPFNTVAEVSLRFQMPRPIIFSGSTATQNMSGHIWWASLLGLETGQDVKRD
jgi:hypothetical protein